MPHCQPGWVTSVLSGRSRKIITPRWGPCQPTAIPVTSTILYLHMWPSWWELSFPPEMELFFCVDSLSHAHPLAHISDGSPSQASPGSASLCSPTCLPLAHSEICAHMWLQARGFPSVPDCAGLPSASRPLLTVSPCLEHSPWSLLASTNLTHLLFFSTSENPCTTFRKESANPLSSQYAVCVPAYEYFSV